MCVKKIHFVSTVLNKTLKHVPSNLTFFTSTSVF